MGKRVLFLAVLMWASTVWGQGQRRVLMYGRIESGGKQGVYSEIRDGFGVGWLWGGEVGVQLIPRVARYSLGAQLQFRRVYFGVDDLGSLSGSLRTTEYGIGAQLRFAPQLDKPRLVTVRGGYSLIRTSVEVLGGRSHIGPTLGIGLEQYVGSTMALAIMFSVDHFQSRFISFTGSFGLLFTG